MDFWLIDVLSTINVNGNDVAFDYINTYLDLNKAIAEAKEIANNPDVLKVAVHHWILNPDGSQEHANKGDKTDIPFEFHNIKHREWED